MSVKTQQFLFNVWLDLLAILWPTSCLGCGLQDRDLCQACSQTLVESRNLIKVKPKTAVKVNASTTSAIDSQQVWISAGVYESILQKAIVALKHQGRLHVAKVLGAVLAPALTEAFKDLGVQQPVCLVLIPSRKSKERERGFSHLEMVTKNALKLISVHAPIKKRVLITTRGRTGQVGLDEQERMVNAARIKIKPGFKKTISNKNILLIDDVITTGATLKAASELLERHEARVLGAVTLSIAQKRSQKALEQHGR